MAITDYTTYGDIRVVLGVSIEELPDSEMSGVSLWYAVKTDINEISSSLMSDYETIVVKPSPTVDETLFLEATELFSSFSVAYQLLDSLPMFAPKTIIEGKSNITRYSDSPYKSTSERVSASYLRFKKKLRLAYEQVTTGGSSTTTFRSLFGGASPTYDPVTGV